MRPNDEPERDAGWAKVTDRQDRQQPQRWPRNRQRERVLALVRERDDAVDAAELAALTGLHVTTARFHLDALCDDGAVERTRVKSTGVGRPKTGYVAVQDRLDYRMLTEVLAEELGATVEQRRQRAQRAGRRWAERITAAGCADADEPPSPATDPSRRVAETVEVFERMGFGPEPADPTAGADGAQTLRLRGCPVRDLARSHPEVSCAMHLGLLRGLLNPAADGQQRPLRADLKPFVEPQLCVAKVIADD